MSNRTKNSLRNSYTALAFYFLEMLIAFWSRKVFIDYLGTEVLGLNTTSANLLQFLNIAELGIVSAVTFTLYKPIANRDKKSIDEIISVQGWLYRRIGVFVLIGAVVMMCFFPLIFAKVELPMWYVYATFSAYLYSSLLTYFFNYKQIILSASQQEYKITMSYKSILIIKNLVQIYAISHFNNPYEWWLILHFAVSTLASVNINRIIKKNYPNLDVNISKGKELKNKYQIIITKVKQLFFHKIAGFVLSQTSSLIIYAFTSLTMVALYGNYIIITNSIKIMFNTAFNGVNASIGHLISTSDTSKSIAVFKELFTLRFLCTTAILFSLYRLLDPFICVWIGSEYLMDSTIVILILAILYIEMMRGVIDSYIAASGLFKDIYAPIVEAVLNLTLSITLGYFFGISGILSGVLISLLCVVFVWKPYFLFKHGMKCSGLFYVKDYIKHIIIFAISATASTYFLNFCFTGAINTFLTFVLYAVTTFITFATIESVLLYIATSSMKNLAKRFLPMFKVRK